MSNKYYVYEWIRLDTNEPFYIGKGKDDRCYKLTRGNNKHFNNIVKSIPVAVHILLDNLEEKESCEYECWYIWYYKDVIGYNMCNVTDGGEGRSVIGVYNDEKNPRAKEIVLLNTLEKFKCIKTAMEFYNLKGKSNISNCCKGKLNYSGVDKNGNRLVWRYYEYYVKMTDSEIAQAIKKANNSKRGKNHSNYGGKLSKIGKNHSNSKKVLCITTNEIFDCVTDAMRKYNIKGSSDIGRVCNGKRNYAGINPSTHEKLIWKWVD